MGIFVRRLNSQGLDSMEIVSLRAVLTALFLLLFLLIFDRKMLCVRLKDIWCFLGTGMCSIVFFNFCYFKAITMTSLSVAAVLLYTAPAIVMVLSYFLFHEKLTGVKLLSLLMTFVGCILVTGIAGGVQSLSLSGILTGLGAGFGYALYSIFSRYALEKGYHSMTISFYTFLLAAAATLPFVEQKALVQVMSRDIGSFAFCIAFAAVSTVIPYITYTLGLKYTDNGTAAIIASVEPVMATLLSVACFHEKMSLMNLFGVILVLGSIVICNLKYKRREA